MTAVSRAAHVVGNHTGITGNAHGHHTGVTRESSERGTRNNCRTAATGITRDRMGGWETIRARRGGGARITGGYVRAMENHTGITTGITRESHGPPHTGTTSGIAAYNTALRHGRRPPRRRLHTGITARHDGESWDGTTSCARRSRRRNHVAFALEVLPRAGESTPVSSARQTGSPRELQPYKGSHGITRNHTWITRESHGVPPCRPPRFVPHATVAVRCPGGAHVHGTAHFTPDGRVELDSPLEAWLAHRGVQVRELNVSESHVDARRAHPMARHVYRSSRPYGVKLRAPTFFCAEEGFKKGGNMPTCDDLRRVRDLLRKADDVRIEASSMALDIMAEDVLHASLFTRSAG